MDIKVRHLLSHLSGVRHYEKDYMNQVGYVEKHSVKKWSFTGNFLSKMFTVYYKRKQDLHISPVYYIVSTDFSTHLKAWLALFDIIYPVWTCSHRHLKFLTLILNLQVLTYIFVVICF